MHEERKGLVLVTSLKELNRVVGNEGRGLAFLPYILAVRGFGTEPWVVVVALARKNLIGVEAFWLAEHVPLAYHTCLIACLLQVFADEWCVLVYRTVQCPLPALVAVHASHQASTAGGAKRVLDVSSLEEHTALCKAVQVGRRSLLRELVSVSTDGLIAVVVAHDIDDVPALCLSSCCSTAAKKKRKEGGFHGLGLFGEKGFRYDVISLFRYDVVFVMTLFRYDVVFVITLFRYFVMTRFRGFFMSSFFLVRWLFPA